MSPMTSVDRDFSVEKPLLRGDESSIHEGFAVGITPLKCQIGTPVSSQNVCRI
jgi:hypothetical protein